MSQVADSGVAAKRTTYRLRAAMAEQVAALMVDGGVGATGVDDGMAATTAENSCSPAAATGRMVHGVRTHQQGRHVHCMRSRTMPLPPSWSCPLMVEWLSDDDEPVPLAIVGEIDEIIYGVGGENVMQTRQT